MEEERNSSSEDMDMKTRVRDRLAQEDILAQRHLGVQDFMVQLNEGHNSRCEIVINCYCNCNRTMNLVHQGYKNQLKAYMVYKV